MLSIHGEIIAGMLFFLFLLLPLPSPLTPILSLLSLPPFPLPHILFLANFNLLLCSSSPANRYCGDAPRGISAASPTCVQDFQNGSVLVLLLRSGMPHSSPPRLLLLISLHPFFLPSPPPTFVLYMSLQFNLHFVGSKYCDAVLLSLAVKSIAQRFSKYWSPES